MPTEQQQRRREWYVRTLTTAANVRLHGPLDMVDASCMFADLVADCGPFILGAADKGDVVSVELLSLTPGDPLDALRIHRRVQHTSVWGCSLPFAPSPDGLRAWLRKVAVPVADRRALEVRG